MLFTKNLSLRRRKSVNIPEEEVKSKRIINDFGAKQNFSPYTYSILVIKIINILNLYSFPSSKSNDKPWPGHSSNEWENIDLAQTGKIKLKQVTEVRCRSRDVFLAHFCLSQKWIACVGELHVRSLVQQASS